MNQQNYPSLYQINTRVWLSKLSVELGRPATLDDIPDAVLERLAAMGFDWIWLLSVWTTGETARRISREHPGWRADFEKTLPDLKEDDIGGSGFAVCDYHVHPQLGGDEALQRLRTRMQSLGLKLMLDFVPNHMGPDHPWVAEHPDYFVAGTEAELEHHPQNFKKVKINNGDRIMAYGRDPYFDGWPDTVQLDYSNPDTVEAMTQELLRISNQCDGVRCDMAMLVLPDIFERTWGRKAQPFWANAINAVRAKSPGFLFMAEVYWDMEWTMQQEGFDYAYDKRLYHRLVEGHARPVREHLHADVGYQQKLARFLENHDEPRAAATFEPDAHKAAAMITFTVPGLRFFHNGQFEGWKKRISPHLVRGPHEPVDEDLKMFYRQLLEVLRIPVMKTGEWQWMEGRAAWDGNGTWNDFVAHVWQHNDGNLIVVVNYSPHASQCYLPIPFPGLAGNEWRLQDLMSQAVYDRNGNDLQTSGLFLDLPAWHYHVFSMTKINRPEPTEVKKSVEPTSLLQLLTAN